jgi:hypothetical protein
MQEKFITRSPGNRGTTIILYEMINPFEIFRNTLSIIHCIGNEIGFIANNIIPSHFRIMNSQGVNKRAFKPFKIRSFA